jgi:undecaprenyl-diphosphatase
MTLFQSILLGIVQGITEFLPISSSAHLILISRFLNYPDQSVYFDIILHLGTLGAILFKYRSDLINIAGSKDKVHLGNIVYIPKVYLLIIITTIVTIPLLLIIQLFLENIVTSNSIMAFNLIFVGILLIALPLYFKNTSLSIQKLAYNHAILLGVVQAIASIRGVSRSGIMILTGLYLNLTKQEATKYAFLSGIPILIISTLVPLTTIITNPSEIENIYYLIIGFMFSFATGLITINLLLKFIEKYDLAIFGYYRIILGIIILIIL